MTPVQKHVFFATINLAGFQAPGVDPHIFAIADTTDKALKAVCKIGQELVAERTPVQFEVYIWTVPLGLVPYFDILHGAIGISASTGKIEAFLELAYKYEAVALERPLTSAQMANRNKWRDARIARQNRQKCEPIGKTLGEVIADREGGTAVPIEIEVGV